MSKQRTAAAHSQRESQFQYFWRRFKRNKAAVVGMFVFLLIILLSLSADLFFDYEADAITQNADIRLQGPSAEHWFGTDHYGRDVLARIVYGARMSLLISLSVTVIGTIPGLVIGFVAGYFGGKLDSVLMRICDMFMAIPALLMAITIVAALGPSVTNLIIALSIAGVPGTARFTRSMVLRLRGEEYVESARAVGTSDFRIMYRHIFPNIVSLTIVNATLSLGSMILAAAGLSFIGLGVQPPTPEWGTMLANARNYFTQYPYLLLLPGAAILITVLAVNLFGDGLRDALDPKMK